MSLDVLLRGGGQLERVRKALDAMRAGGIWDHLGGGFHRYSTDERWLVPHFEKMLYDNALLLRLYIDGWRATGDPRYAQTARAIAAYLAREMTSPEGALLRDAGRRQRGRGGTVLRVDPGAGRRGRSRGRRRRGARREAPLGHRRAHGNFEESGATVLVEVGRRADASEAAALERARVAILFEAREKRAQALPRREDPRELERARPSARSRTPARAGEPALSSAAERAMRLRRGACSS